MCDQPLPQHTRLTPGATQHDTAQRAPHTHQRPVARRRCLLRLGGLVPLREDAPRCGGLLRALVAQPPKVLDLCSVCARACGVCDTVRARERQKRCDAVSCDVM
jgi:hypothetical protein